MTPQWGATLKRLGVPPRSAVGGTNLNCGGVGDGGRMYVNCGGGHDSWPQVVRAGGKYLEGVAPTKDGP